MKHEIITSLIHSDMAESVEVGVQMIQPESRTHGFQPPDSKPREQVK